MKHFAKPLYVPSLRAKPGEMQGLNALAQDVADRILPHMISIPRQEREDGQQTFVTGEDAIPADGVSLARSWFGRRALLNPEHLFPDFTEERCGLWLPKMFEKARLAGLHATPVAALQDLAGARLQAFNDAIRRDDEIEFAVRIPYAVVVEADINDRLERALERLGVSPERCVVLLDFTDADFSQADIVAGVIENAYDSMETTARWYGIALEGTSYPVKNPASHGGHSLEPRNEWKAWKSAVHYSDTTPTYVLFGDYAADCARMLFGKVSAAAIRHHRYTTPEDWFVVRGAETGSNQTAMRDVCRRIIDSPHFAGRGFSSADDQIYKIAREGSGAGMAKDWRAINTTHHITRVVRDLGRVKSMVFEERTVAPAREQFEMFNR